MKTAAVDLCQAAAATCDHHYQDVDINQTPGSFDQPLDRVLGLGKGKTSIVSQQRKIALSSWQRWYWFWDLRISLDQDPTLQ